MFGRKRDIYGYPVQSNIKRLILIVLGLVCTAIIIAVAAGTLNKSKNTNKGSAPSSSGNLELLSLGADAYIKYPSGYVLSTPTGIVMNASSPEDTNPKESIAVTYYQDRDGLSIESLELLLTTNANGRIKGMTSNIITSPEGEGRGIVATWQQAEDTKLITADYYLVYPKKIWLLEMTYQPGSFLDKSQREIAESFISGEL